MSIIQRFPEILRGISRMALGQLVRELGYSLPRASSQDLRLFRAEVAAARDHPELDRPEEAFTQGALFAMAEVCASYEAEVQAEEDRRQRAAFSVEKPLDNGLLHKIFEGMTSPGDLAEALGKDPGQISRALNGLRAAGLIELVQPGPAGDQRRRFYRLTTEGLRILSAQSWQTSPGKPKDMMILEGPARGANYLDILSSRRCRFVSEPLRRSQAGEARVSAVPSPRPRMLLVLNVKGKGARPVGGRVHAAGPLAS